MTDKGAVHTTGTHWDQRRYSHCIPTTHRLREMHRVAG